MLSYFKFTKVDNILVTALSVTELSDMFKDVNLLLKILILSISKSLIIYSYLNEWDFNWIDVRWLQWIDIFTGLLYYNIFLAFVNQNIPIIYLTIYYLW